MSDTDPNIGRVLGSYRLVSLLAEGGMSSIYVGAHTRLNRYAAIKLLKPALQHRREAMARFFEEARTVNRIEHPNIVESLDLVEDAGAAYCVLELLQGPSLARRLADGRIPLPSAIHIGVQIADALHAVHAAGIVHRDLKPENLILVARHGRDDFVRLIDFGVAQMGTDDAGGAPFGTAAYMAPEQAAGERVDGRADVYALGVLLFEMATGRHPFPSSSDSEYVLRHADEVPPTPSKLDPQIPRELDAVILRCLEKQPGDRYPDAAAVATALRALEAPSRRRRMAPLAIVGLAAVAAVIAVIAMISRTTDKPAPSAVAVVVDAPAPVQAPDASPTVTLTFRSTPQGARVFRPGETVPLGMTPFQTTLRAGTTTPVRFELAGYEAREVEVSLAEDATIDATLDKQVLVARPPARQPPPRAAKTRAAKTRAVQREGVMDPFAQDQK